MKIGKYPVKHTYKIARLIADVFSAALIVLIFSATLSFFTQFNGLLSQMDYFGDNVNNVTANFDANFVNRQWLALIYPVLALGVVAAYLILTLKNHSVKRFEITKLTAQSYYDTYAFCVSLCKIPALLGIFDLMYITHQNLLGGSENWFSLQLAIDVVIIAFIIRFGMHKIAHDTAQDAEE